MPNNNTLIIAHRGGVSPCAHENTLEAFLNSINLGVDMNEFDIRKTLDDKLIVYHDKQINNKHIKKLTYKELCAITSKQGFVPPLLKDVLLIHNNTDVGMDIELKEWGYEDKVLNSIKKYYSGNNFVIKSFYPEVSAKIKELDNSIKTGLLLGRNNLSFIEFLKEFFPVGRFKKSKADFLAVNYHFTNPITLTFLKFFKVPIYVWTVNDVTQMKRLIRLKLDGIITDRPEIALNLVNKTVNKEDMKPESLRAS